MYKIRKPKILNKKCTSAMARPATLPVSAANKAVAVVPILAPMVTGSTDSIVKRPAPAIGTRSEVVMELDCTAMVRIVPNIIAIYPFFAKRFSMISPLFDSTTTFIVLTMRLRANIMRDPATIATIIPAKLPENSKVSVKRLIMPFDMGLMADFTGELKLMVEFEPYKVAARNEAVFSKKPVISSSGSRISTVRILNMS